MDSVALGPDELSSRRTTELPPWLCLVGWEPSGHVGVEFRELCPKFSEADDDLVRVAGLAFAGLAFAGPAFTRPAPAPLSPPRLAGQLVNCLPDLRAVLNG